MTNTKYISHLEQMIELKFMISTNELVGRLNCGFWVRVSDCISNFERKIKNCKTKEELAKLFNQGIQKQL